MILPRVINLTRSKPQTNVSITYYLLNDHSMMHSESEDISSNYLTAYRFHEQSFIVSFLFRFLKYFFLDCFSPIFPYCVLLLILILY